MESFTGIYILPDHKLFCQNFLRIERLNLLNSGSSVGEFKLHEGNWIFVQTWLISKYIKSLLGSIVY